MTFKQAMVKHAISLWKHNYLFKREVLADFRQHFDADGERGVRKAAKVWRGEDSHKKLEFFPRTYT